MSPAAVLSILVQANTAQASAALSRVDAQAKKTAGSMNAAGTAAGGKFAKGAKVATGAAVALAAYGLFKAIGAGAEFEKQMDSLGAVTEASGRQMGKLEKQALKLGQATVFSANEVAEAQTTLAKGGLTVKQILGGALPAALSLAAAGELDLATAADTTANALNLFGLKGKEAQKIADMMATAANTTTADVIDFAMALKQGGSAAKIAGVDLNNTMVILEALAKSGIKNSDAGTSLKAAFIQLLKPSTKQAELAEELGIQWTNQAGTMKSAVGISRELRVATEGMTKAERAKTLATLAGADGFRTLAALYDLGPAKLKKFAKANEEAGTAQEIARKKMDNLSGDAEQLGGALETLGIKASKLLKPALRTAVQWLTRLLNKVGQFSFRDLQRELGISNKDLHKFGEAAKNVADIWRKYFAPVIKEQLKGVIQALRGFLQIVKGIVQLISGILTGDFDQAWKGVKNIFRGSVKFILGNLRAATAPFRGAAEAVGGALKKGFDVAWAKIKGVFEDGRDAVIGVINAIIDAINLIPGVEIDKVRGGGGGDDGGKGEGRRKSVDRRFAGGAITKPMAIVGEEAPRHHEWVIATNPAYKRDNLRYWAKAGADLGVPGFAGGGVVGKAAGAVAGLAGKGADFFVDKLPTPNIPEPFKGVGPYMIDQVTEWIKNGFDSEKFGSLKVGPLGVGSVMQNIREAIAIGRRHGSGESDLYRPGAASYHNPDYAPPHQAVDLSGGDMMGTAKGILKAFGVRKILELFYNPLGFQVDNYRKGPMTVMDHYDHVHAAFREGGLLKFLAQGGATASTFRGGGGQSSLGEQFQSRAHQIWEAAAPFFGRPSRSGMPSTMSARLGKGTRGQVVTTDHQRHALLARKVAKGLVGGDDKAEQTLLHEWAHVHQNRRKANLMQREGGAEAFAFLAGPQIMRRAGLGFQFPGITRNYKPAHDEAMRKGRDWVLRKQFLAQGGLVGNVGNILMRNGLDMVSSAGILGNAWRESRWNTSAVGTGGGGLWGFTTSPVSLDDMKAYAASQGMPWTSALAQTQFMLHHLPGSMKGAMNSMSSVEDTTSYFMNEWERPGVPALGQRIEGAKKALRILEGSGASGLTDGEQKRHDAEARKKAREAQLVKLRQAVADAKSTPAKVSKLWKLTKFWGRAGVFDKEEKGHLLDSVQKASSQATPEGAAKVLSHLASWASKAGEITGRDPDDWHSMTDAIQGAQERGKKTRDRVVERNKRRRDRKIARIAARGNFPELAKALEAHESAYEIANQGAERLVALEPEDLGDSYVDQERGAWGGVLGTLATWRDKVVSSRDFAGSRVPAWQEQIDKIKGLQKEHPKAFKKQKWRIKPLREAITNAQTFIADRGEELTGLQGVGGPQGVLGALGEGTANWLTLGGPGARIFDTQNTIRELAIKVGGGQTLIGGDGAGDAERIAALEEMLREANLRNLVFERQKPVIDAYTQKNFAGMFAKGGDIPAGMWGVVGERGPEPVFGPATVVSNDNAQGAFGSADVRVEVFDHTTKVYVNDQEVEEVVKRMQRSQGRSAKTIGSRKAGRGV